MKILEALAVEWGEWGTMTKRQASRGFSNTVTLVVALESMCPRKMGCPVVHKVGATYV
jgi:hypothetical protein